MQDFVLIEKAGRIEGIWDITKRKLYKIPSGGISAPSGGNSRPGVPTWARQNADYAYGMDTDPGTGLPTGYLGQAIQSSQAMPWMNFLNMMQGPMAAANTGGIAQRQLASSLTSQAIPATQGIANASMGGAGGIMSLLSQIPGFENAAMSMAQNINRGATGLQGAIGAGNQTLQNVMNPTAYNPLYQNAMNNEITPTVNAAFSARGLGSSGGAIDTISRTGQNLADSFAQRQFGEQLSAQQNVGGMSNMLGQLGIAGAEVPGQIFNQLMTGAGQAQNSLGTAMQNQLGPLGALTAGSQQYWQGVNNPLQSLMNISGFANQPLSNVQSGTASALGTIGSPTTGWLQKVLGKA